MSTMLKELARLHALGLAIHWLKPNSKIPLEVKWTAGGRKSLESLRAQYKGEFNMGVRLGKASLIGAHYLAVIDCVVKSKEQKHKDEMVEKLRQLFPALVFDVGPHVLSGRGNGSLHVYVKTVRPAVARRLAQSGEKVKVKMPSVRPSKAETAALSEEDLAAGWRLRPAWEISLMGEGQQVVLPPSIHPDTGAAYKWGATLTKGGDVPVIDQPKESAPAAKGERVAADWKPVEVVDLMALPEKVFKMVVSGEGVEDRSASLMTAARAMVRCGYTREEILTVLTDRENFLGQCAYDHTGLASRAAAAQWVGRYTLDKAAADVDARKAFMEAVEVEKDKIDISPKWEAAERGFYKTGKNGGSSPDYDALFNAFVAEHPYRMVSDMKFIYVYNGTHYRDFNEYEAKGFAERVLRPAPCEKFRNEFANKLYANNLVRRSFFIDTVEGKFNFKNGVLDLSEPGAHTLLPHSPEFGFRAVLPYNYDSKAKCPEFEKWVHGIMLEDEELVAILQEFMGYVVRGGEYKYHKALWLDGAGRNGKSTFLDVVKALIGEGNYSNISIKALMGDKFASSELDGKLANFSDETDPKELGESGPFKNLTGDGDVHAQKKYGDLYHFRNRAKLIMSYNKIPDLRDDSGGMHSRPLIVPFRRVFSEKEQDRGTKARLLKELPGIFNFALAGWERLEAQRGFTQSAKSASALKRIAQESCNVFQWVEGHLDFEENFQHQGFEESLDARTLYRAYKRDERYAFKFPDFARRLYAHPKMEKRFKKFKLGNRYQGVKPEA